MLIRCYGVKYQEKKPTYIGCTVCSEWLRFSVFKSWMKSQDWIGKHLDKDVLNQGNKVYSPDNCLFVTPEVNSLIMSNKRKVSDLPAGVTREKKRNKFRVSCRVGGVPITLNGFDSSEDAFEAYKLMKYSRIKEVALNQSEPLRSALLRYKIL